MNEWTCIKCGTHNEDPVDAMYKRLQNDIGSYYAFFKDEQCMSMVKKHEDRRHEYEDRGEIFPEYCTRCQEIRT